MHGLNKKALALATTVLALLAGPTVALATLPHTLNPGIVLQSFTDSMQTTDNTATVCSSFTANATDTYNIAVDITSRQLTGTNNGKGAATHCILAGDSFLGTAHVGTPYCTTTDNTGITITPSAAVSSGVIQVLVANPNSVTTATICRITVMKNTGATVTTTSTTSSTTSSTSTSTSTSSTTSTSA
jgi:hypothetical protein